MSSSIFIEPTASAQDCKEAGKHNPDSNLVVVYSKNGINIDPKDLETLIEEKAAKTISVIRITSPTPSMEEAEEAERLEAAKDQVDSSNSDEATDSETKDVKRRDTSAGSSVDSEDGENSSDVEQNTENKNDDDTDSDDNYGKSARNSRRSRNMRRSMRKNRNKTLAKKRETKQSTEVMGLTLEGFYEAEAALEIAKEACKMAGIPYIRNTAEYEFMLFVIRNDHCYTPYTSPEQMKAKLAAEKLEAEKLSASVRKIQPQLLNTPSKHIITKLKKLPVDSNLTTSLTKFSAKKPIDEVKLRITKDKSQFDDKPVEVEQKSLKDEDDEETFELVDVEDSDYTGSDQSDESDNDRDSDLDFNVNKRQTKFKRKISLVSKKARRLINAKIQEKRSKDERPAEVPVGTASTSGAITVQRPLMVKSHIMANNIGINSRQINPMQITSTTKGISVTAGGTGKFFSKPTVSPAAPIRTGHVVHIGNKTIATTPRNNVEKSQTTSQTAVKEIVINKVLSSPKGCFTELTTLISEAEKSTSQIATTMQTQPITPTASMTRNSATTSCTTPSRTCFMRIDATAKNALPAQISVETHQSSSELLAAEHDKQLDLIDSIVTDELNKSLDNITEKPSIITDENIPKLVQMLENTEKALESNSLASETVTVTNTLEPCMDSTSNNTNTNVDDIDISHDLPEDLLQHVVELIKDDKTLQEAVEKEILEQENNFALSSSSSATTSTPKTMQHLQSKATTSSHSNVRTIQLMQQITAQRSPPTTPTMLPATTSKSIIEMSISNTGSSSPGSVQPRSSLLTRRDPIQIVRGNGRVITLPPIEAPTTRAKRRAQVVPNTGQQSVENSPQLMNESSLDNSLHSNASFSAMSVMTPTSTGTPVAPPEAISTPTEQKIRETTSKRRTSKEGNTAAVTKSARKSAASKSNAAKRNAVASKQDDTEASESQGDDDDPKRLWCLCRQPHNNRFMICCDACGDWFHGTCVNVTKAMGREMEQKGIEWSCPQCNKKREERSQRKLTDMLQMRRTNSQSLSDEKVKSTGEVRPPTDDTHESAIKKETFELKKVGSVQQIVMQTPPSKKSPIVQSQGQDQKKLLEMSPSASGSQIKAKVVLITPVRAVTSSSNAVIKQASPQVNRTSNTVGSKPSSTIVIQTSPCVLCKKPARPNTIYCSDDCIRRSAQNAINAYTAKSTEQQKAIISNSNTPEDKKKKAKGLFEDLLSMADRKPKVERIVVYDRNTGTKHSGSNAPTTLTIKKWLHDNPSFEVVLPGSQLSIDIEKQQQQRARIAPKQIGQIRTSNLKIVTTPATSRTNQPSSPVNQQQNTPTSKESVGAQSAIISSPVKTIKQIIDDHKNVSGGNTSSSRPNTPRQLQKYPQHVQIRPDIKSPRSDTKDDIKSKDRQLKRQSSDISTSSSSSNKKSVDSVTASSSETEPVRKNVRRTLKEQILQRMNEVPLQSQTDADDGEPISTNHLKLTPQEVETFVKETEAEMFNTFNRDTGARYKSKYRSLIFNIKDRKNRTLFAKICAKQIDPKQLVHMSPEELASQELAQWRQNENKHQLEMIKKSELDLLSCSKNYLFKNHKGEEMIESKERDVCVNLDMTIPVEDVVNVLNNSAVSANNESQEDTTDISGSENTLKQNISSQSLSTEVQEEHTHHSHYHQHQDQHHSHREYEIADGEKATEEKSKLNRSESEKRESRGRDRRHRSKSRDSERERDRERHQRSKSKDSEKDRGRGREKRQRSREHYHRDKSRSKRRSHSRSKSRSRSEEKRYKSSSHSHKEDHRDREREREREKDRDNDRDRERKEKKGFDTKLHAGSSVSNKTSASAHVQLKEKHRNSPAPTVLSKHKPALQPQKSMECFNLIDQIIESSKTVEEAANLVRDTSKEKIKEKEKPKEQQSPVIATSTSSLETTASTKITIPIAQCSSTADSDQEPSSTVSIPTPPHDSYAGEEEPSFSRASSPNVEATEIWSGGLSMNDVASLQIRLHHLIGNSRNIGRYMPENLDVVGRIDGNTVWEYLSKIRKSPNKEIVLLRLMPYSEDDAEAYTKLFQYLDQKKRLGVIKSMMPQIKDFYIYPLESGKHLPKVLQVTAQDDFYNDPFRPDMIIGVIVRVLGKRMAAPNASNVPVATSTATAKLARRNRDDAESFTPPGSPKRRKHTHKGSIDLDAIIKAPIVAKTVKKTTTMAIDADEPYSPGGSSDDDIVPQYSGKSSSSLLMGLPNADEDLKRKMEEINRQIAAQEMEIAGLLNVEPTASASVLANISIPSNLPQILASIKNKDIPGRGTATMHPLGDRIPQVSGNFDEYNPEDICSSYSSSAARHSVNPPSSSSSSTSRLAQLSEAELLSMVPDDMLDPAPNSSSKKPFAIVSPYYQEPPPPGI